MPETPKTHIQIRMPGLSNKIYNVDARGRTSLPSEFRKFLKENSLEIFYLIQLNNPGQDIHIVVIPHPDGVDNIPNLTQAERNKLYNREYPTTHDKQGRINLSGLGIKNTEIKYLRGTKHYEIRPKNYKEEILT